MHAQIWLSVWRDSGAAHSGHFDVSGADLLAARQHVQKYYYSLLLLFTTTLYYLHLY